MDKLIKRHMSIYHVETGNGILIQLSLGHAHITQTTTNKMKTPVDECGWYICKQTCMLWAMGFMALVSTRGIYEKLGNYMSVNTWRACIMSRNCF